MQQDTFAIDTQLGSKILMEMLTRLREPSGLPMEMPRAVEGEVIRRETAMGAKVVVSYTDEGRHATLVNDQGPLMLLLSQEGGSKALTVLNQKAVQALKVRVSEAVQLVGRDMSPFFGPGIPLTPQMPEELDARLVLPNPGYGVRALDSIARKEYLLAVMDGAVYQVTRVDSANSDESWFHLYVRDSRKGLVGVPRSHLLHLQCPALTPEVEKAAQEAVCSFIVRPSRWRLTQITFHVNALGVEVTEIEVIQYLHHSPSASVIRAMALSPDAQAHVNNLSREGEVIGEFFKDDALHARLKCVYVGD